MTGALITAAGKGSRMRVKLKKQFIKVGKMPVLAWTLSAFERCDNIDKVVITVDEDDIDYCFSEIVNKFGFKKVYAVVPGGVERQDSVRAGLSAFGGAANGMCSRDIIIIHDGARPLVTCDLINRCISACCEEIERYGYGSVCAAVPVKDTIRTVPVVPVVPMMEPVYANSTLPRNALWAVQTPQVFDYHTITRAHRYAYENNIVATDDNTLAEKAGVRTRIVMGEYSNIKLTTAEDLDFIRYALLYRNSECDNNQKGRNG